MCGFTSFRNYQSDLVSVCTRAVFVKLAEDTVPWIYMGLNDCMSPSPHVEYGERYKCKEDLWSSAFLDYKCGCFY